MKTNLPILAFVTLSACGGTGSQPAGVGLSSIGATSEVSSSTTRQTTVYGETFARQGGQRAPGFYQTSNGVPWLVINSPGIKSGRAPLQGVVARRYATSYASSKWKSPHAKRVNVAEGSAMLRIVSVDGVSFAVMKKVKAKAWLTAAVSNDPYFKLMDQGIAFAGCQKTGDTSVRMGQYGPQSISAPVKC